VTARIRSFSTDGYFIVPEACATGGHAGGVKFVAGNLKLDFSGAHDRLFLKLDVLAEERQNGTVIRQFTSLGTLAAHWSHELAHDNISCSHIIRVKTARELHLDRGSARRDAYDRQTLPPKRPEPRDSGGRSSQWTVLGGGDFERVEGTSIDRSPRPAIAGGPESAWIF